MPIAAPEVSPRKRPTGIGGYIIKDMSARVATGLVLMAAVRNRLARSDDGGVSFTYVGELWSDYSAVDPEGSAENGIISSETASPVSMEHSGGVTWYGAHLRYFLRPQTGYKPKYATSWQVRIGAASTPAGLTSATETVLGVSTTAPAYKPMVQLDRLAGLRACRSSVARCSITRRCLPGTARSI